MNWYLSRIHGGEMAALVEKGAVTTRNNHTAAVGINDQFLTTHFKITGPQTGIPEAQCHLASICPPVIIVRLLCFSVPHLSAGPQRRRRGPQCLQGCWWELMPINSINQSGWRSAAPPSKCGKRADQRPVHPINPEVILVHEVGRPSRVQWP